MTTERAGRGTAYLAALGCALIWGANYTIAKRALAEIDALAVAFARALVAVLFFGVLLLARDGRATVDPARLRRAAPLGLLGILANQVLFIVPRQSLT